LQAYVDKNELLSEDTDLVFKWINRNTRAYIFLYKDGKLFLDNVDETKDEDEDVNQGGFVEGEDFLLPNAAPTREEMLEEAEKLGLLPIEFADGTLLVSLYDNSERYFRNFTSISSILIGFFFVCASLQGGSISGEFAEKVILARNISIALSIVVSFLLIFVTFFFVVYDFFKSLFSPQGYLSFTLPVSSNQLLASKVIVYGGWMILSYAAFMLISAFLMNYTADEVIGMEKISFIESLLAMLGDIPSTTQIIAYIVYIVMMFFVIFLSFVSIVYFSITVSHVRLLQKHSIIASIVIFFVTAVLFLILAFKTTEIINFVMVFNEDKTLSFGVLQPGEYLSGNRLAMEVTPGFAFLILDVIMFFATSYVMHKKVNLK
jgi:hypothetical protein